MAISTEIPIHSSVPLPNSAEILDSLMKNRYSCRYYLPNPVPLSIVEEILDAARYAPAASNMQPWHKVFCVAGDVLKSITKEMLDAYVADPGANVSEYAFYPDELPLEYLQRRHNFGRTYYGPLHIDRHDKKGRQEEIGNNYLFYGAPVGLIFTIHRGLLLSSGIDIGYFLQSVTLAARARGLETVSEQTIATYHEVLRKHLPIDDDEVVLVGMALGSPDLEKVSKFYARPQKRTVPEIAQFFGFENA
ncbi:nitroreductase [Lyophyllum atratum]|nr:nitroreductase [Lyophyllum atratum]